MSSQAQDSPPARSVFLWCLPGFALSYVLYFLRPVFGFGVMRFLDYVPAIDPIGWDLVKMLGYSQHLLAGESPYIMDNLYPPLAMLIFSPLTLVDAAAAYRVSMGFTLLSFVMVGLVLPVLLSYRRRVTALTGGLFLGSLFSYGLQFELERGQFNLVAMALALVAVYVFHHCPRARFLSYFLFLASVQLKIYPLMLLPLFIDDWRTWKRQLPRIIALGAASFACTFALGLRTFLDFANAVSLQMANPQVWIGNHSIAAFSVQALPSAPHVLAAVLLCLYGACLGFSLVRCARGGMRGLDPLLLLVCATGTLVLPSISHDYTLPLLAGPVAIFLDRVEFLGRQRRLRVAAGALVMMMAFTYSSILFPYTNRPSLARLGPYVPSMLAQSALPFILVVLVCATLLTALASAALSLPRDGECQPAHKG